MTERPTLPAALVGDGDPVPCVDGVDRPYLNLDAGASTAALPAVAQRVNEFLPDVLQRPPGRRLPVPGGDDRLRAGPRAALTLRRSRPRGRRHRHPLPQHDRGHQPPRLPPPPGPRRRRRHHRGRAPRQPAAVGPGLRRAASSSAAPTAPSPPRTSPPSSTPGPGPPCSRSPRRPTSPAGAPTRRDHRRRPRAGRPRPGRRRPARAPRPDARRPPTSWPGAGTRCTPPSAPASSSGPGSAFADGDPFLAGGGAVDLVDLDEVIWTEPPEREEAGSPNVIGAVALHAAIDELAAIGWDAVAAHDDEIAARLRPALAAVPGVRLLGPGLDVADPADGGLHRRRRPPRPGRRPAERRVRHRGPPRLLLCPPLPAAPARPRQRRGGRLPRAPSCGATGGRSPGRSGPAPACPPPPRTSTASSTPSPHRRGRPGAGHLRPGRPHRRLLAPGATRRPGWTDGRPRLRRRLRPGLSPAGAQTSGRAMQTTVRSPSSQLSSVGRTTRSCSPPQWPATTASKSVLAGNGPERHRAPRPRSGARCVRQGVSRPCGMGRPWSSTTSVST